MSVLLDQETVVLEGLDFEPGCDCIVPTGHCGEEATHMLVCRSCGDSCGLSCMDHAIRVRVSKRRITHTACGVAGQFRKLVDVVPL